MILSLVVALSVQAADAQDGAPPPPAPPPVATPVQPAAGNPDDNRRICRTTQATGTRLGGRRICRTVAEWRRAQQNTREEVGEMQRDAQTTVPQAELNRPGGG